MVNFPETESDKNMALWAFIEFSFKNYMRQHRYLRDLAAVVIFSVFFGGFLGSDQLQSGIWWVFAVFALILNLLTAPAVFFLEKGNTLYFLLSQPLGRRRLFLSKIILIVLIDLSWVLIFAVAYGLRFLSADYFLLLPLRMGVIALVLMLSTLLLSFSYTYHPQLSWLIFVLLVFGNIVRKEGLLPMESPAEIFKALVFLLPPFFEITSISVSLTLDSWHVLFLLLAIIQVGGLYFFSMRRMLQKDMI